MPYERDVRPAYAQISELRRDNQMWRDGQMSDHALEKLLKRRCQGRFGDIWIGTALLPDALRISLKQGYDCHGEELPAARSFIISRPA